MILERLEVVSDQWRKSVSSLDLVPPSLLANDSSSNFWTIPPSACLKMKLLEEVTKYEIQKKITKVNEQYVNRIR